MRRTQQVINLLGCLFLLTGGAASFGSPQTDDRPNILLIIADDLGFWISAALVVKYQPHSINSLSECALLIFMPCLLLANTSDALCRVDRIWLV